MIFRAKVHQQLLVVALAEINLDFRYLQVWKGFGSYGMPFRGDGAFACCKVDTALLGTKYCESRKGLVLLEATPVPLGIPTLVLA